MARDLFAQLENEAHSITGLQYPSQVLMGTCISSLESRWPFDMQLRALKATNDRLDVGGGGGKNAPQKSRSVLCNEIVDENGGPRSIYLGGKRHHRARSPSRPGWTPDDDHCRVGYARLPGP